MSCKFLEKAPCRRTWVDTHILVIAFVGLLSQFVRGVYLGEYPGPVGCWVAAIDPPGAPDFERFSTG